MNHKENMQMNQTLQMLLTTAVFTWAGTATAAPSAPSNLDNRLLINKVLNIDPDRVDEFVQKQDDIKNLTRSLEQAQLVYQEVVKAYSAFQAGQDNEYNKNEKFKLFRQFDGLDYQQKLEESGRDVRRAKYKLNAAVSGLSQLQARIEQDYQRKHALNDEVLRSKLLAGETVEFTKQQKPLVFAFLTSLEHEPQVLARMLANENIVSILPDYLKEQLRMFKEAKISLPNALANVTVMQAFTSSIGSIEVEHISDSKNVSLSVYKGEKAMQVSNLDAVPVYLGNDIDAETEQPVDPLTLYNIPVPSRQILDDISGGGAEVPAPGTDSIYTSLSDYALDNVNWADLDATYNPEVQAEYLAQLMTEHGPATADVTVTLPTDIQASFTGPMKGNYLDGSGSLSGTITLNAIFNGNANSQLSGGFVMTGTQGEQTNSIIGSIPQTTLSGPSNFQTAINAGDGQTGALQGSFFGAEANEIGGVWVLGDDNSGQAAAAGGFKAIQ